MYKKLQGLHLRFFDFLILFIPFSFVLNYLHANSIILFFTVGVAIAAISHLIAESTAIIATRVSNTISAFFNATFGNAIEFFIAIFALRSGFVELVKASITGSIIINVLLLIGLSMLMGGLQYKEQRFNKDSAGLSSTMLIVVVVGLALPSIYSMVSNKPAQTMSLAVSVILGIIYLLSLLYIFVTHKHLFVVERETADESHSRWSIRTAIVVLFGSTLLAAFESSFLVNAVEPLIAQSHINQAFTGLVVIALLTNIPEHISAVTFATRNNITLSLEIGMSSALQIALFVVPTLVLISSVVTGNALDLVFNPLQLVAVVVTAMIANYISSDGICHWVEGAQLIAVYLLIAIAFYFL